jgi:hypothetical protein
MPCSPLSRASEADGFVVLLSLAESVWVSVANFVDCADIYKLPAGDFSKICDVLGLVINRWGMVSFVLCSFVSKFLVTDFFKVTFPMPADRASPLKRDLLQPNFRGQPRFDVTFFLVKRVNIAKSAYEFQSVISQKDFPKLFLD